MLRREAYENLMAERLCRCVDFVSDEGDRFKPYVARVEDSACERVWRLGVAGLQVAKALPLSSRAYAAVHSIDAIRRWGRVGLTGIFLKDELLSMLSALRRVPPRHTYPHPPLTNPRASLHPPQPPSSLSLHSTTP